MSLIDDVAQHLHNQGIASLGTNLFKSYLPNTPDNALAVLDTGGYEPDAYLPTTEPTFQVIVRATDYSTGKSLLDSVRSALHRKSMETLTNNTTFFFFILAVAEGAHIGRDANQRDEFSINFRCRTR